VRISESLKALLPYLASLSRNTQGRPKCFLPLEGSKTKRSGVFGGVLKTWALLLSIMPVLVVGLGLSGFFLYGHLDDLESYYSRRGKAVANELAVLSLPDILAKDARALEQKTRIFLAQDDIERIHISDAAGKPLLDLIRQPPISRDPHRNPSPVYSAPVVVPDSLPPERLGVVQVHLCDQSLDEEKRRVLTLSLAVILTGIVFTAILTLLITGRVLRPFLRLIEAMGEVKAGNLDMRVPCVSSGELLILEEGFNEMASRVALNHEQLEREVTQATADYRETLDALEERNIELYWARKEADRANAAKSEFLANMSHEIRTPLHGIVGFANQLLKTPLSDEQQEFLRTIIASSRNLQAIINDVLNFSKLQQGKLQLNRVSFDLRDMIDDLVALFATLTSEKRLEVLAIVYNDVPDFVVGDRLRLQQVLTNLLSNAVKFTQEGEILVRVMLDDGPCAEDQVTLRFSVQDTGIGISRDAQRQLFTAFTQADASTERRFGGTGLGLSICKQMIQGMDGDIGVKSQIGKGSDFWFRLSLPVPAATTATASLRGRLQGVRALVVDQQPHSRAALLCRLEYLGVNAVSREPEVVVSEKPFPCEDLSFLSLSWMDAIQGVLSSGAVECILDLKRRCALQPLVAQVKAMDAPLIDKLSHLGVDACYIKPMGNLALLRLIGQLLGLSQAQETEQIVPPEPPRPSSIEGMKVLIVDDNPINLRLASVVIHAMGGAVTEASSGAEAIRIAGLQRFDFILMDAHMPGINGMEATKQIRAEEPEDRRTPILALTADTLAEHHKKILNSGMDAVLIKPFHEEELLEAMRRIGLGNQGMPMPPSKDPNAPKTPQPGNLPVRDRSKALLAAAGLEAEADALFMAMQAELEGYHAEIGRHAASNDWEGLGQTAHKLRGSARVCGAMALEQVLADLEECGRTGETSHLDGLLQGLDWEIDRVRGDSESGP